METAMLNDREMVEPAWSGATFGAASGRRPRGARMRRSYRTPRLERWGSLVELTHGPGPAGSDGVDFTGSVGV